MRRRLAEHRWIGGLAAIVLLLAGCGKGDKGLQFDLTPVAGIVMLDGQPLADADVAFYLQGNAVEGYRGSAGKTDAQGKYELVSGTEKGAVPGSYKVTVSAMKDAKGGPVALSEGIDLEQLKMQGQAQESLPPKYSDMEKTELTITVEKGKPDGYDLPLTSP